MLLSALSFLGLSMTDFSSQQWLAGIDDSLGFSVASALLASGAVIMAAAPKEKVAAAGAIETMAYELGAGLGIALFGLILTRSYSSSIVLPGGMDGQPRAGLIVHQRSDRPCAIAARCSGAFADCSGETAFISAHSIVLATAGCCYCCWPPGSGAVWRRRRK